jgi:hypothetical protein
LKKGTVNCLQLLTFESQPAGEAERHLFRSTNNNSIYRAALGAAPCVRVCVCNSAKKLLLRCESERVARPIFAGGALARMRSRHQRRRRCSLGWSANEILPAQSGPYCTPNQNLFGLSNFLLALESLLERVCTLCGSLVSQLRIFFRREISCVPTAVTHSLETKLLCFPQSATLSKTFNSCF